LGGLYLFGVLELEQEKQLCILIKEMSLIKYIKRLQRMDTLISMMATGTPEEFAYKMGIKRSTLFQSIQEMRELGVSIKYSNNRQTYYYSDNHRLRVKLEKTGQ
jgi:biotin operon repressor